MALYFFHLDECGTVLADTEGMEFATIDKALGHALISARDVMIGELRAGRLCLGCSICISDPSGDEVGRVRFRDAVTITGAGQG